MIHYLWALMFMKIYSSETALCAHAGGVDPKTFQKWIWPFILALAELEYTVVSLLFWCISFQLSQTSCYVLKDSI